MRRSLASIVVAVALVGSPAFADNLVPNASFEEASDTQRVQGWHQGDGGWWTVGKEYTRHGERCLSITSERGSDWVCDQFAVEPDTDYRLEGWLRRRSGKATITIEFLDNQANPQKVVRTPDASETAHWQYVAVETNSDKSMSARLRFVAQGDADLDEVSFAPIAVRMIGNRGVEKDNRGRLGFWQEEKADVLDPAQRAGTQRFDDEQKREGNSSVVLEPKAAGNWFAIGSVNYPLPGWTGRLRLSGWARSGEGAAAQLAACWMNDVQEVLRIDLSPESTAADWHELQFFPPSSPAGATTVRVAAVARGGPVWFDEFDLQLHRPDQPVVKVFVNQVGYDAQGPKSAVVATNFFPAKDPTISFAIRRQGADGDPEQAETLEADCAGRIHSGTLDDWGWYFWRADFSNVEAPGTYTVIATARPADTTVRGESPVFVIEPNALLDRTAPPGVDFFFVQRCGFDVPGWHAACHLDDANLPDGTHIDVTGGWHSAGDYNKPMWQFGDSAAVYALAVLFDEHRTAMSGFDRDADGVPDALDEAAWGATFLAKMQNRDDGSLRGDVNQGPRREWMRWTAPDVHTDNKIGTPDDPVIAQPVGNTPLAIAGWARLATILPDREVAEEYLDRARKAWEFYAGREGAAGNSLLVFGAVELFAATGDRRYRDFAEHAADELLKAQRPDGSYAGDSGDHGDWAAAAIATLALRETDGERKERLRTSLEAYLEFCLAKADNPFGISRQGDTADKELYFHPTVGLGVNFWILGRAWAAALIHRLTEDQRARVYAVDQVDWVFGKNPVGLCMFEGRGEVNPPRYHHRYNMIAGQERGAVPGAIPNGFVSDMGLADRPGFDLSRAGGRPPSHRTSEPWLVHNIVHLLAVSAMSAEKETARP